MDENILTAWMVLRKHNILIGFNLLEDHFSSMLDPEQC